MSEPADTDDFLGWAPDAGSWDAPVVPAAIAPQLPAVVAPTPPPPYRAPLRRSGVVVNPPKPSSTPPYAPPNRRPASRLRVPILAAAAVVLVFTFFTALLMATEGPQSSPVMLAIFGVVTALLGRVAWGLRRR